MRFTHGYFSYLLFFVLSNAYFNPCFALEPEPRKWNHIPIGTNFAGLAYVDTEADIFFDPVLMLEDVNMSMKTLAGAYIRTFELFGKSARIDVTQGYKEATWTGLLDGVPASTSRRGFSDTFVRFGMNFYGAPALRGKEYLAYRASHQVETIVGAGLVLRLPTGDYDESKLLNLGQNRFVIRPQVGFVHNHGNWTTELTGEIAFHGDNDEFFNGKTLEQKPMYILIGHVMRSFKPGQWLGVSFGGEYGGENTINGVDKDDTKLNVGWAINYVHPVSRQASIKLTYVGIRRKELTGFDSNTLAISGVYAW